MIGDALSAYLDRMGENFAEELKSAQQFDPRDTTFATSRKERTKIIGDVIVKGAISPAFDPKYEVDGKLKVAPGWLHANAVPRRLALWDVRKAPTDEDKRMFVPLLGVAKTYGGSWRDEENKSNNMEGKLDEKGHMTKDKKPNMHSATGYREHIAPKFPGTRVRDWKYMYTLHRPNLGFHNLREVRAVKANLKPRTEPRSKYYY